MGDNVHHPTHYTWIPGVECIEVVQHFNYNLGTALAYIWRAGHQGDAVEDLRVAITHLEFEIARIQRQGTVTHVEPAHD